LGCRPSGYHRIQGSRCPPSVGVEGESGRRRRPPCITPVVICRQREKGAPCSPYAAPNLASPHRRGGGAYGRRCDDTDRHAPLPQPIREGGRCHREREGESNPLTSR
jgi:hypothetical protein